MNPVLNDFSNPISFTDSSHPLDRAFDGWDIKEVERLLRTDPSCWEVFDADRCDKLFDENGMTLLHQAVCRRDEAFVALLLENGCTPNVQTPSQITPLHIAAQIGEEKIVDLLLEAGADPSVMDYSQRLPFDQLFHTPDQRSIGTKLFERSSHKSLNIKKLYNTCYQGRIDRFSKALEEMDPLRKDYVKEMIKKKLLAHAFELDGLSATAHREEGHEVMHMYLTSFDYDRHVMRKIEKQLRYLMSEYSDYFLPEKINCIIDACAFSAGSDAFLSCDYLERIRQGEPVILSTGYLTHAVEWVFWGDRLALCDRKKNTPRGLSVEFYRINRDQVTLELIEALLNVSHDLMIDYHNLRKLALEGLECSQGKLERELEKACPLPKQIVENCVYSSAEASVWTLFALQESQETIQDATECFKQWQMYARASLVEKYFDTHLSNATAYHPDVELCTRVYERIMKEPSSFSSRIDEKYRGLTDRFKPVISHPPQEEQVLMPTYIFLMKKYFRKKTFTLESLGISKREGKEEEEYTTKHKKARTHESY